jgi:hypothetical protein
MNWGKSIILVFVLFAVFIIYFVIRMINTNTSGVPDGYYEKGLMHSETMNEVRGAVQFGPKVDVLGKKVLLSFSGLAPDSGNLIVQWPPNPDSNMSKKFSYKEGDTIVLQIIGSKGFRNTTVEFFFKGEPYIFKKRLWVE